MAKNALIKKMAFILFFLWMTTHVVAQQDTLRLMNGKLIVSQKVEVEDSIQQLNYLNKKGKLRWLDYEEIYSLRKGSNLRIFYKQDSLDRRLKAEDMHYFILGEAHARENFNSKPYFWGGMAAGAGSVFLMPALGLSTAWAPVGGVGLGVGATRFPIKDAQRVEDVFKNNPHFANGYRRAAARKRNSRMFLGIGTGLAVAILATLSVQ